MAMPAQLACHIAQDLIVAYVLGDLRPETAAWVSEHLQSCPSCQEAVRQAQEAAGGVKRAAPPPPADAGRNLVGRVRRRVRLLVTVVVGCLLLTGVTGIYLWRNPEVYAGLTGLITDMGVPGADTTPREVIESLAALQIMPLKQVEEVADGGVVGVFGETGGPSFHLTVYGFHDYPGPPARYFDEWYRRQQPKLGVAALRRERYDSVKFSDAENYYAAFRKEHWIFIVAIPKEVPGAAEGRNEVFRALSLSNLPLLRRNLPNP